MTDTRYRVQQLVQQTLVEQDGSGAVSLRPIGGGLEISGPTDYLAGIRAARKVGYAAETVARDYARHARGEGRTWAQVAEVLGITSAESDDPAADAFLWVAPTPSMPLDTISASWECLACGARVRDVGPYGGHPDDVEDGHAQGCTRHDDEVRAYLASTGWDD